MTEMFLNKKGQYHREDGPAVFADGTKYYYKNGLLHRENGPAIEYKDGSVIYYKNGFMHREDGPAIISANGKKQYCIHVGTDSRGYAIRAVYFATQKSKVKYRVITSCHNFTGPQALKHWKDNQECLELVKKAIAKFDLIKTLIECEAAA
jgi:hypothetical protein